MIPAIVLLLISAIMMSTATYAWFSMNNKVTVSGMEVRTRVSDNLFIAKTTLAATAPVADANFGRAVTDALPAEQLLEPVSTVDGKTFFYTDSENNVAADGSAKTTSFIAYAAGDDFDKANGVDTTTSSPDALGYVDYVFELKAVNGSESSKLLKMTQLNLTYKGVETEQKAFRVAIFMQKFDGSAYTMINEATLGAADIFAYSGSAYFGGKAVSGTAATATAPTMSTGISKEVAAGQTEYYKVVVRIWLEGQDTTCNNDTFASLTKNWAIDFAFELGTEDLVAATSIGRPAVAATASGVTLDANGKLSNGETPAESGAYKWYNALTGAAVAGATTASAPAANGSYFCEILTTAGNTYYTGVVVINN